MLEIQTDSVQENLIKQEATAVEILVSHNNIVEIVPIANKANSMTDFF